MPDWRHITLLLVNIYYSAKENAFIALFRCNIIERLININLN